MPVGFLNECGQSGSKVFDATIGGVWSGGPSDYYTDIDVPGILATDNPIVDVVCDTASNYNNVMQKWARVYKIETYDGYIRVYVKDTVVSDLPVRLMVVR